MSIEVKWSISMIHAASKAIQLESNIMIVSYHVTGMHWTQMQPAFGRQTMYLVQQPLLEFWVNLALFYGYVDFSEASKY